MSLTNGSPYSSYPNFYVGNPWKLDVYDATPYSLMEIRGWHNGTDLGTTPFGNTNDSGFIELAGTMDSSAVGFWVEDVYVGGGYVGSLSFSVSTVTACTYGSAPTALQVYSTDNFYLMTTGFGPLSTDGGSTSVTHEVTSGPCVVAQIAPSPGAWLQINYYPQGNTGVEYDIYDSLGLPYWCPRCYDMYFYFDYYPVYDSATVTTVVVNTQNGDVRNFNTYVSLWVDYRVQ